MRRNAGSVFAGYEQRLLLHDVRNSSPRNPLNVPYRHSKALESLEVESRSRLWLLASYASLLI